MNKTHLWKLATFVGVSLVAVLWLAGRSCLGDEIVPRRSQKELTIKAVKGDQVLCFGGYIKSCGQD